MDRQSLGVFSATDHIDDPVLMASVQGAFFGVNLPAARIEGLIAAHVPKRHIADVADVYGARWWDYRRLAPGHSFMLFVHTYYHTFRTYAGKFRAERARKAFVAGGHRAAALIGGARVQYTPEEIWERDQAHITGLWKAMLVADAFGIPYASYCQFANQTALDWTWTNLPKPQQLYSDKLGAEVLTRWRAACEHRLFVAKHPMYRLDNYAGLAAKDAYQRYLIEQCQMRGDPAHVLANILYRVPQLPESEAAKHFPAQVIARAQNIAS